jgi:hypothetical protein
LFFFFLKIDFFMKLLASLLSLVLLLAACRPSTPAHAYRSVEANGVAVELSDFMVPTVEDVDPEALVDYEDLERSVFCVVYRETKADLMMQDDTFDLTGYLRYVAGSFQDGMNGSTFSQVTEEQVNGLAARFGTVTGDVEDGGGIFMRLGAYETPDAFYKIVVWCEQSGQSSYEKPFDHILRSFRLTK